MKPLVEQPAMALAVGLDADGAIGGLDESLLEIVVHVATGPAVADAVSAGDDVRHEPGISGQMLGAENDPRRQSPATP